MRNQDQVDWVLVADSSRARLFEAMPAEAELREIENFFNPEGRMKNRELVSDAQGRVFDRGRPGESHSADSDESAVDHGNDLFAQEIVARLEKARTDHRYGGLSLISPPRFLGKLRSCMDRDLRGTVRREIDKDLSLADARTIAARLKEFDIANQTDESRF